MKKPQLTSTVLSVVCCRGWYLFALDLSVSRSLTVIIIIYIMRIPLKGIQLKPLCLCLWLTMSTTTAVLVTNEPATTTTTTTKQTMLPQTLPLTSPSLLTSSSLYQSPLWFRHGGGCLCRDVGGGGRVHLVSGTLLGTVNDDGNGYSRRRQ